MKKSREERLEVLIGHEYQYLTQQFLSNENMGEKRVGLFVTLTAGLGAAGVLAKEKFGTASPVEFPEMFLAITGIWFLFGYLTFLRILRRNISTDQLKEQLRNLRIYFVDGKDMKGRHLLPYDPYDRSNKSHEGLKLIKGRGGYLETVALINSIVAGVFGWQLTYMAAPYLVTVPPNLLWVQRLSALTVSLVVAWCVWVWQARQATKAYSKSNQ